MGESTTTATQSTTTATQSNNVFEIFQLDNLRMSFNNGDSFDLEVVDHLNVGVNAVATLNIPTLTAAALNGDNGTRAFIQIQTTLTVEQLNNETLVENPAIQFKITSSVLSDALGNFNFSDAEVTSNAVDENVTTNKEIKYDVVRNMAYKITGSYTGGIEAFDNATDLLADVANSDNNLRSAVLDGIYKLDGVKTYISISETDDSTEQHIIFQRAVKRLFDANMNDSDDSFTGRLYKIHEDIKYNNIETGDDTTSANLRFNPGDIISFKIKYNPKSVSSITNSYITGSRTYRVIAILG